MVLLGMLEFFDGASAKDIVAKRRYHHQYLPDHVQHEKGALSSGQSKVLLQRGHQLAPVSRGEYGNMQLVIWDRAQAKLQAAADPRGVGRGEVRYSSSPPSVNE
jgi:gamma-glutamyltranspeptidase/glutathione hydrolase